MQVRLVAEHQRDADLHGGLLEGERGAAVRPRDQEHQQRRGWVCQCPRLWLAAAACDVATLTGVETRIPGFGNTTNVEWIDKSMRSFSTYFALIVSKLLPEVRLLFKYLDYECFKENVSRATCAEKTSTELRMTSEEQRMSTVCTSTD